MDKPNAQLGRQATRSRVSARMRYYQIQQAPRLVLHAPPIRAFGYAPDKREQIDRRFTVIGFSFVVRGEGWYHWGGRSYPVSGPCMLIQWPGESYRYGPSDTWEELFVTYAASAMPLFRTPAWTALADPVIPLPDRHVLMFHRNEILAACRNLDRIGGADRMDALFAALLLEVVSAEREVRVERKLYAIRAWIDVHYQERPGIKEICARFVMPERSLLRQWRQAFDGTPANYMGELRMRRACELLVGTDLTIGEVAEEAGFADPLYFSRCFHRRLGMPPGRYREGNR